MPFKKVQSEKLAQSVVRQIELLILQGILRPGERLPSERELSERMGVSRPSLREAVADLHDQGTALVALSHAGDQFADAVDVFVEDAGAFVFAKALDHGLLGGLRGDPAELFERDLFVFAPDRDLAGEPAETAAQSLSEKIAALETLVGKRPDQFEPDDPGTDDDDKDTDNKSARPRFFN